MVFIEFPRRTVEEKEGERVLDLPLGEGKLDFLLLRSEQELSIEKLSRVVIRLGHHKGLFEVEGNLGSVRSDDLVVLIEKEVDDEIVIPEVGDQNLLLFVDSDALNQTGLEEEPKLGEGELLEESGVEVVEEVDVSDAGDFLQPL